jgi:outer membrane protein OmpA-like peptidoglycan-associated protein
LVALALGQIPIAFAQEPITVDAIIAALTPHSQTRGVRQPLFSLEQMRLLQDVRQQSRGLSGAERSRLTSVVGSSLLPAVDLDIRFGFNSDKIAPQSAMTVVKLGAALTSKRLGDSSFIVAGHTDAVGRKDYNQLLSERRATAVRNFLVENFGLKPASLIIVGYGQEALKNTSDPYAAENRRVQILNMGPASGSMTEEQPFKNDPLSPLDGSWLSVNPPGGQVSFHSVSLGLRETSLPMGRASVTVSDGTMGSNLRLSGEGFNCYYFVGFINPNEMTWQLKQGDPACMETTYLKRGG